MTMSLYNPSALGLKKETHGVMCIVSIIPRLTVRSDRYLEAVH
jgi:hypothetical protein